MGRGEQGFVKIHKESPKIRSFVGAEDPPKAQIPLFQAIIMQFTIISQKSSIVKYFCEKILDNF